MGTIFHKVMECLANGKKCLQDNVSSFHDDALGDMQIDEKTLFNNDFIEHLFESSYNFYSSPEKSIHKYYPRDKKSIKKWINNTLGGYFDPRTREIVAAEPHFDFPIERDWAHYEHELPNGQIIKGQLSIKGTIDLVTKIGYNNYEAIDWKTGECKDWGNGKEKFYKDFLVDPQLRMYFYALRKKYKEIRDGNLAMTMHYVRTKGPFTVAFDEEDELSIELMLKKRFEKIKATIRPGSKSPNCNHWFCKRICWYGKNPHKNDSSKSLCKYIKDYIRKHGVEKTIEDCSAEGFDINYYHDPGS